MLSDEEQIAKLDELVIFLLKQVVETEIIHEKNDFYGFRKGAEVHFDTKEGLWVKYKDEEEKFVFDKFEEPSNKYCWIPELMMYYNVDNWVDQFISHINNREEE